MKKRGLRMVYIEPGSPVTPEQMENGVLYFLAQSKRQMTPGDQNAIFV
jgi:hypothetical protein